MSPRAEGTSPDEPPDGGDVSLLEGEIEIRGRIMPASNQTFLGELVVGEHATPVVYKPRSGERPLWDFPDGSLADREYAAWLVSDALGWDVVPPTVLRDGPRGIGMVQRWCEPDPEVDAVDLVPEGAVPTGYRHVLDAFDGQDRPCSLIHEDSMPMRRMAIFDAVVNNTDRKGGHVLAMADGHRYGVDHGICFHVDDKLRTVLWGWSGEPLADEESDALEALQRDLGADLGERLAEHLTGHEIARTRARIRRMLTSAVLPATHGGWPSIPWPPF